MNSIPSSSQHSDALKIIQHSFDKNADIIFIKTEDLDLIRFVSSYRPHAYVFIFSKEAESVRRLTALNYGVFVFDEGGFLKVEGVLQGVRGEFGFRDGVRVVIVEQGGNGLVTSRFREVGLVGEE